MTTELEQWRDGEWWRDPWWRGSDYVHPRLSREEVDSAVEAVKRAFPASWVLSKVAGRRGHPIFQELYAQGLIPFANLCALGSDIASVSTSPGYRRLTARLRDADAFYAARSEVTVGALFARRGYAVSFEPEVGTGRRPDLLISKGAENIYVEVKMIGAAERERFIAEISEQVSFACFPELPDALSCEVELSAELQGLWGSDAAMNERLVTTLTRQVVETVRALVASGRVPAETNILEIATIRISPKSAVPYSAIRGATLSAAEEIARVIRNALRGAAEQLPDDAAGVVVVGLRFLPEESFARLVLETFFEDTERFAHLSAIVLTTNYMVDGAHQRWGLVVENPKARWPFENLSIGGILDDWLRAERRW
jgi:hypothetical protein